jgi:hypothetical protein
MTAGILSRVCVVAILHEKKLLITRRAVVAKRTFQPFATWRQVRHQQRRAKGSASAPLNSAKRRKSRSVLRCVGIEQQQASGRLVFAGGMPKNSRGSAVERGPPQAPPSWLLDDDATLATTTMATAKPLATEQKLSFAQRINAGERSGHGSRSVRSSISMDAGEAMPPPPTPGNDDVLLTRSSRSTSSASRNMNRLSITLPIAPPTCDPTRPVPMSATSTIPPSFPATPAESISSQIASPSDTNEFIIAIAAQERRVMELREELQLAEKELKSLKLQFTRHESGKAAGDRHHAADPHRTHGARENRGSSVSTPSDDDKQPLRRSADLDRRRQILQSQHNTPREAQRRVFTGKHTRTLSLLSPTKTDAGDLSAFSALEDSRDICKSPTSDNHRRNAPPFHPNLAKRMTWQPRSSHSAGHTPQAGSTAMSQIVADFKLGFQSFYEDIRQITVGDEPITGRMEGSQSTSVDLSRGGGRNQAGVRSYADDQDTIRPVPAARPRLNSAFDSPSLDIETPTRRRPSNANLERINPRQPKRFSWTPLTCDSVDADAWISFDSPSSSSSGKSTRWSGSTINDEINDAVQSTAEKENHSETPL